MSKKLIIINGIMGVGKSTVCRNLYKKLDNCFFLEGDDCWRMNPFTVNDENKKMVIENITYMLNSFIKNSSSKYILFNWVIQTDEIMKSILERLDLDGVDVYRITLMCSREELEKRIAGDIAKGVRDSGCMERSMSQYDLYKKMHTIKINTDNTTIDERSEMIIKLING